MREYSQFRCGINKDMRASTGVSILGKKNLSRNVKNWEQVCPRIIEVEIRLKGCDLAFLGVNASSDNNKDDVKDRFYNELLHTIETFEYRKKIILLTDLNTRTRTKSNDRVVEKYGEENVNNNGERLVSMCEYVNLKILYGYYQHKIF